MNGKLEETPLLIAQGGPLKGQRWPLEKVLLIGREATCDVVIPDRMVSRFHARLAPRPKASCSKTWVARMGPTATVHRWRDR